MDITVDAAPQDADTHTARGPLFSKARAIRLCWVALLVAPCLLVAGHMGTSLNWQRVHISYYAAKAPLGDLVTLAMALSTVAIVCMARLLPTTLRPRWWAFFLSFALCIGAAGLVTLAVYEVDVARRMHNRGLFAFFFVATPAMILAGLTLALNKRPWSERLCGLMASLSTASGVAVYVMWSAIKLDRGVRQRLAFLLVWIAALLLLWVISKRRTHDR